MNNKKVVEIILILIVFSCFGCKKAKNETVTPTPINKSVVSSNKVDEAPKEKHVYVYQGDKYRDPFMPAGISSAYQVNTVFDPKRITIKAIIVGKTFNSAVLSQGNSISYFVKAGHIIDVMGKTVQGFKANVYENKVVLIGDEENTFEIKIRNSEKEEKAL